MNLKQQIPQENPPKRSLSVEPPVGSLILREVLFN